MKNIIFKLFGYTNFEAIIWIVSLLLLFLINSPNDLHFTICPIKNTGLFFCPGCGLGASIHYLLHLNFSESFSAHPLGLFAVIILLHRIIKISGNRITVYKNYFNSNFSDREGSKF
jgi:hypothetical protein